MSILNWPKRLYRNLGLKKKLIIVTSCFIICCVLGTSGYLYLMVEDNQTHLSYSQLKSIRESKSRQIENYFARVRSQVTTLSNNLMTIDAMKDFSLAFAQIENDTVVDTNIDGIAKQRHHEGLYQYYKEEYQSRVTDLPSAEGLIPSGKTAAYLQYHYIAANKFPTQNKEKLDFADDNSQYSQIHKKYHSRFRQFLQTFGYYDIFLIDSQSGDIVYSVYKEIDYATNLLSGAHSDSNIGHLFREVRLAKNTDFVKLVDYQPYQPSYGNSASFIASPIFDNGVNIGVLIFQMPIYEINAIMTGSENWLLDGLGNTGESVIVGNDGHLRSQSRFLIEQGVHFLRELNRFGLFSDEQLTALGQDTQIYDSNHLLMLPVDVSGMLKEGYFTKAEQEIVDYRGEKVLAAFTPLNIKGVNWQFLTKIDSDETYEFLTQYLLKNAIYCLVFGLILVPLIFLFANSIANPLQNLSLMSRAILIDSEGKSYQYHSENVIGELSNNINGIEQLLQAHKAALNSLLEKPCTNKSLEYLTLQLKLQFANKPQLQIQQPTKLPTQLPMRKSEVLALYQSLEAFINSSATWHNEWTILLKHCKALTKNLHRLATRVDLQAPLEGKHYQLTFQLNMLSCNEHSRAEQQHQSLTKELEQLHQLSVDTANQYMQSSKMVSVALEACQDNSSELLSLLNQTKQNLNFDSDKLQHYQKQIAQLQADLKLQRQSAEPAHNTLEGLS